ncbi:SPOR domain-containing protein [Lacinutrix undariae]
MLKQRIKTLVIAIALFGSLHGAVAQKAKVTVEQDSDIETLLEYKKDIKTVELYKIQVYSGDRSSAQQKKANFVNTFNEWDAELVYETPKYKVWVGKFRSRLEADKALIKIKKDFNADAFIFQPKKESK